MKLPISLPTRIFSPFVPWSNTMQESVQTCTHMCVTLFYERIFFSLSLLFVFLSYYPLKCFIIISLLTSIASSTSHLISFCVCLIHLILFMPHFLLLIGNQRNNFIITIIRAIYSSILFFILGHRGTELKCEWGSEKRK